MRGRRLYEAGAELVLSGHDHVYERFAPQDADGRRDDARGIRQFVAGTGGAFPTPLLLAAAPTARRATATTIGVLKLVLGDGGYEWEFLAAPTWRRRPSSGPTAAPRRCH